MKFVYVLVAVAAVLSMGLEAKKVRKIKREVVYEEVAAQPQQAQFKFRNLQGINKQVTQYEQCKMECKRQRDSEAVQDYVQQLKDELVAAEAALAAEIQAKAEAAALAQAQAQILAQNAAAAEEQQAAAADTASQDLQNVAAADPSNLQKLVVAAEKVATSAGETAAASGEVKDIIRETATDAGQQTNSA